MEYEDMIKKKKTKGLDFEIFKVGNRPKELKAFKLSKSRLGQPSFSL